MPDDFSVTLSPQELSRLEGLNADARLDYFMETLTRLEAAWALEGAGKLLKLQLPDGRTALPLWPHPELAALESKEEAPRKIGADLLADMILPELASRRELVALFPVRDEARVMEAGELLERIIKEWEEDD